MKSLKNKKTHRTKKDYFTHMFSLAKKNTYTTV